jgi:enoyl-CoA hydratase/carnithine racemase
MATDVSQAPPPAPASTQVQVERREGGAAWVTLARPDAMNALSGQLLRELDAAIAELAHAPDVRAIVITGSGDKAFSAGADLKERRGMSAEETRARIDLINAVFNAIARVPRPTIAALNGVAFGGGLELALACDFRVATAGVQLGLTEVRLGIMPGAGGTQRLARLVGASRAKELILLGRRIDAAQAHAMGLVHEVAAPGALAAIVDKRLGELSGSAPVSVAMAKQAIDRGVDVVLDEGLRIERQCYEVTLGTEDRNEGLRAFAEKRPPRFQGK